MEKLLPCPHCGHATYLQINDRVDVYFVVCSKYCGPRQWPFETEEEIVESWNEYVNTVLE